LQYKNDYNSTDDNQGIITWSLFTNSSWLNINKNSGVISGIPDNEDVGIYYVNVTVDDGNGGMDFSNFSINVFNTNDRPLIITPNNLTAIEDVYYDVDYEAEDVDIGDSLTWNIESNASWLFIDINTGILTGTPDNYEVGCYNINISCKDDSEAFDFTEFILTVININDFPVITTEDIITAYEDIYYENDYDAIEIDIGDSISWSLQTNASWLEIDSETGLVQGIPDNSDVGTYWVNVTCTDNNEGFDFHYFELTVINTNDVPILMPIEDITLTYEDQYYEQIYNYIDIDSDEVDWTFKTNATWLNWGKENHTLFGTPINNDVGSYWVRINITDNHGGFDEHYFNLNVINVNDAPFIDGAPMELEINALEDYELEFSEYVFDVDNSLKDLELIIDTDHAIVNGLNIIFNYPNSINSELITIAATDGLAFSNEHHIEIAVILKDLTFPDVLDKEPTGDGVPITTNITITFSEEMDFETVVDSFEVSPIVYGKFIQNNTIIIFNPISDFDYNTEYWVTIDITATDLAGNPLQKVIEWNFTTEKPTIDTDNDGFSDDIDAFPNDPRYHSDSDNDSMPDTWEDQYGLDKYNSIDASEDLDKDGKSNLNEFIDGTDPTVNGKTDADQKEEDSSGYIILAVIVIIITIVIIFLFLIKTGKIKLKLMGKREEE
ncbi:MAG: Ig-like domain-containing protein, partial [Thermoplasmata archaeon]|nr:Ig-like domain-containing protein [Thermoplasmata archaeon]